MSRSDAPAPDTDHAPDRLAALRTRFAQPGRVQWLGLRPAREMPMRALDRVEAVAGAGLRGDRYASASGTRGVTLIQAEHLPAIAALLGRDALDPARMRRNVVVAGCNLLALIGRRFRVGDVLLEGTDACEPCARMELALGDGGYSAMLGHGGITARVIEGGAIAVGNCVQLSMETDSA